MAEAWLGQVYNSTASVTIGGTPTAPTAGYRYLQGLDSDEADSGVGDVTGALAHVQALLLAALGGSPTVTLSWTTGLVTIAFGATSTLSWGTSELKAICGFESDIASSTGATGTLVAKGLWLPTRDAASYPLDKERVWSYETTTRTVRATDGSSFAVTGSNSAGRADIAYRLLSRNEIVRDADPETGTLEQFFADVAAHGLPLRYLPTTAFADGDSDGGYGASEYAQGFWELTEESAAFTDYVYRSVDGYDGLWDVDIPLIKYDE